MVNKLKLNLYMVVIVFLILLGTIFQTVAMFKSGSMYDFGIGYWGPLARDGIWHEAVAGQILNNFKPLNPGLAGSSLTNYHYFYDILIAFSSKVTGVEIRFFIYKLFPILFSSLLGVGTYFLSQKLFKNKLAAALTLFFVYFGSSFGWVVDLVKGREVGGESAFWANQPVSMNLNPPFAISLVLLIFILLLLSSYLEKPKLLKGAVLVFLSGILIGFKIYAGLILLASLFLLTLKKIIVDRDYKLLPIFILSILVSLGIYFSSSKNAGSLIAIEPFWLINTMIDAGDRVGIPSLTARRFMYLAQNKYLHLGALYILGLTIFIVGNLGTRIFAIIGSRREFLKKDMHLFLHFAMIVSLIPTLVFVQRGNAWNIVQFLYYFLFFTSLYSAWAITLIAERLRPNLAKVFLVAVILVTPISSIATFRSYLYPTPPARLTRGEFAALNFLKDQEEGVVLKHPYNQFIRKNYKDPYPLHAYADSAYVSAYSQKEVYIEDQEQQIILGTEYAGRLADAQRFFTEKDLTWSNNFLAGCGVNYVYLPKAYALPMAEEEYNMTKIFENDEVNIYKVLK